MTKLANAYWESNEEHLICYNCIDWIKFGDEYGGIGICDCMIGEHNQHVIGFKHPACIRFYNKNKSKVK